MPKPNWTQSIMIRLDTQEQLRWHTSIYPKLLKNYGSNLSSLAILLNVFQKEKKIKLLNGTVLVLQVDID